MSGALDLIMTPRLRAERLTMDHLPDVCRMDQDALFMAHLGGVRGERQSRDYMARNLEHWVEHGFGLYILRDACTSEVVGRGCLRHLMLAEADEVEVGYGFYPGAWGRALATEIARAFVVLGFETLGLSTIVALTLRNNQASRRVMLKAGLRYERDLVFHDLPYVLFRARS
jgi:RimJ/RimL family protein N-acetyltransferase